MPDRDLPRMTPGDSQMGLPSEEGTRRRLHNPPPPGTHEAMSVTGRLWPKEVLPAQENSPILVGEW